jgi:hypothetical protein
MYHVIVGWDKGAQPARLLWGEFRAAVDPERQCSHKRFELWNSECEARSEMDVENINC